MNPALQLILRSPEAGSSLSAQVAAMYAGGAAGMWLDQSDTATVWQESAKVTAGALNSPVGYRSSKGGNIAGVLQATSAARPTWSARKNLLTYSEQFDNAAWTKQNVTVTANSTVAPDGTTTADTITNDATNGEHRFYQGGLTELTGPRTIKAKAGTANFIGLAAAGATGFYAVFNLATGAVALSNGCSPTISLDANGFYVCSTGALTSNASHTFLICNIGETAAQAVAGTSYVGTGKTVIVWGAQVEVGSTATSYQRVTTATDYDTAGFPLWDVDDGVDDNWAATFAAGTLTNSMSAFLAIQRTAATGIVAGFRAAGSANYFGSAVSGGAGAASALSGAAVEHWVDGVQVPGGTATTEAQLHAALTVGVPHVLEVRGLDLSAWTGYGQGYFSGGYPGAVKKGGTIILPTPSDANATIIRRFLAGKIGATTV